MDAALVRFAGGVARELGLPALANPVEAVVDWCVAKIAGFERELPCSTLDALLQLAANRLGVRLRVVRTDAELAALVSEYTARGERAFALLPTTLEGTTLGETIKLTRRLPGELAFVAVIDARGPKVHREYYTCWHELAHVLTLTDSTCTHFHDPSSDAKDPEEKLMDAIAGRLAFYAPFVRRVLPAGVLSFAVLERVRETLCPGASWQSTLIGVTPASDVPALVIRAELAVKKAQRPKPGQRSLFPLPPVPGQLRAVRVSPNDAARRAGFMIYENMRVPEASAIGRAMAVTCTVSGDEDLHDWESSQRGCLPSTQIRVDARRGGDGVDALVICCT